MAYRESKVSEITISGPEGRRSCKTATSLYIISQTHTFEPCAPLTPVSCVVSPSAKRDSLPFMAQQSFTPSQREAFRRFVSKHLPNAPSTSPSPSPDLCPESPNGRNRTNNRNEYDMYVDGDDSSDEGFGEEWPPFSPKELMSFMTNEQAASTITQSK